MLSVNIKARRFNNIRRLSSVLSTHANIQLSTIVRTTHQRKHLHHPSHTSTMLFSGTMSLLSVAVFSSVSNALPASTPAIAPRAGGPAITPIPSSCTVTNPLPSSNSASYEPAPSTEDAILYTAYYSLPSTNKTALAQQCLEQCYGYGYHVECKTAFWAENLVVPEGYYGTPGGQLSTGCLFFERALTSDDFVPAPEGQAINAFAGSIAC